MSESEAQTEGEENGLEIEVEDDELFGSLSTYMESLLTIVDSIPNKDLKGSHPPPQKFAAVQEQEGINVEEARALAESLAWEEFPGYSECSSAFELSELYRKESGYAVEMGVIEDIEDKEILLKENSLPKFLTRYLVKNGEIGYNEEIFNQTYEEFEDYLQSDSIEYRGLAVLDGFDMVPEKLSLTSDLHIRELSEGERSRLRRFTHRSQSPGGFYGIEKKYTVDKFGEERLETAANAVNDVILALRLFDKKGDISYTGLVTEPLSPFHIETNPQFRGGLRQFYGSPYKLDEQEAEEFVAFWENIGEYLGEAPESYRIAINKFSTSFKRRNENDRLLDSVIALEAMYLKSSETQEMSYRLAQRGALLLSETKEESKGVQKILRDSYNQRSNLVHGSSTEVDHDSVLELHELTRKSLSKFLQLHADGEEHSSILSGLDEQAITPVE